MKQAAWAFGTVQSIEGGGRARASSGAPFLLTLEVTDPEVVAELRRRAEGDDRDRYALAALRVGVLALRGARGDVDAAAMREAGTALVAEVRELLTARAAEMTGRLSS